MEIFEIIAALKAEQQLIEEAIVSIERLARGTGKRVGRPPAWMKQSGSEAPKRRGRPPGSKNKPKIEKDAE